MSAIALGRSFTTAPIYAPAVRAAPIAPVAHVSPPGPPAPAAIPPHIPPQGLGLIELSRSVDHLARVSAALSIADDKLAQIGGVLNDPTAIDTFARSATFGGTPLLDGAFTATVNG